MKFSPRKRRIYRPLASDQKFWKGKLGHDYNAEVKQRVLVPFFRRLDKSGRFGVNILDIGSGALDTFSSRSGRKLSGIFYPINGKKIVRVDLAFDRQRTIGNILELPGNIEHAGLKDFSTLRKVISAGRFFGAQRRSRSPPVDTILFSDVLNYVDYQDAISSLSTYLRSGGRLVIYNKPGRGFSDKFSDQGLKNNFELLQFLKSSGFEIEHLRAVVVGKVKPANSVTPFSGVLVVARKTN